LKWEAETMRKYPVITDKGRKLYSESDTLEYTSIETYLRGELFSYSEKTLQLYYDYMKDCKNENKNEKPKKKKELKTVKVTEATQVIESKVKKSKKSKK